MSASSFAFLAKLNFHNVVLRSNPEQGHATLLSLEAVQVFVATQRPKPGPATKIAVSVDGFDKDV